MKVSFFSFDLSLPISYNMGMALDPTAVALIGTIMGGVGLKIAEHWLGRNKVKVDDATRLRDELRLEITAQREEIRELEKEVAKWRNDYYAMYEKYIAMQTELTITLQKIKEEARNAQNIADDFDRPTGP